jgi:hypothetical protein
MDGTTAIIVPATSNTLFDTSAETVMGNSPRARHLVVSDEDRRMLERWIRMPTAPQRLVLRSRIVLMLADGYAARDVARRLEIGRPTVALWGRRY